jgi:hypothetical protein
MPFSGQSACALPPRFTLRRDDEFEAEILQNVLLRRDDEFEAHVL